MSGEGPRKIVAGAPIGWIVVRRRGGWNAEPEIVRFTHDVGEAMTLVYVPEVCGYDPPADETDVFTYHAVMPCPVPMTMPREVRTVEYDPEAGLDLFYSLRPSQLRLV